MLIIAEIIEVEKRLHKEKQVVDITLKLSSPTEYIVTTMWNHSVVAGDHMPYEELVGQKCVMPVTLDIFKDKQKYQINNTALPKAVSEKAKPTVVPKTASKAL